MISLKGIPAAPGVAMGKTLFIDSGTITVPRRPIAEADIPLEVLRLEEALIKTRHQILKIQQRLAEDLGQEHAEIFNAHLLVLEDQALREEIINGLKAQRLNVEAIFNDVVARHLKAFSRTNDEYLRERTADIDDVRKRVLSNLLGQHADAVAKVGEPGILVAHDLSP